ncbi:MAG: hypothetical protein AAGB12_03720 [Pseudomonadota bacterium]
MPNDIKTWIDQRSIKLLLAVNEVPYDDDHDAKQLALIRGAFRELIGEVMRRSVERTKRDWSEMDS